MSVAEFKAQAKMLSRKELRELAVYFRGLSVRKKSVWRSGAKKAVVSPSDPLLNLDKFAAVGPGGKFTNQEIDRILYGRA